MIVLPINQSVHLEFKLVNNSQICIRWIYNAFHELCSCAEKEANSRVPLSLKPALQQFSAFKQLFTIGGGSGHNLTPPPPPPGKTAASGSKALIDRPSGDRNSWFFEFLRQKIHTKYLIFGGGIGKFTLDAPQILDILWSRMAKNQGGVSEKRINWYVG